MKKVFHRIAGTILSFSLVFTGLSITSPVFAEDPESTPNISEETNEAAVYANIEDIEVVGEGYDYAAIEVTLDKPLEETDMPLFFYEEGNPEAIQEISTGPKWIYFEITKTNSPQYIYATTGSSTSNIVIVDPIPEIDSFEITANKTVLELQQYDTPVINWDFSESIYASLPIFIVDSNGNIVDFDYYSYGQGDFIVTYFQEDEMSYTAYVADNDPFESTSLNDLTNIRMISNTILITKEIWTIQLFVNRKEYTTDDLVKLSWTTNNDINNSDLQDVFVIDEENGNIITRIGSLYGNEADLWTIPHNEAEVRIALYVANENDTAVNISELENIQVKSNVVSTKHTPYELEVSVDKPVFYTYDETPLISWKVNQNLSPGRMLYISYADDGQIMVKSQYAESSYPANRYIWGEPERYKAYIADFPDENKFPSHVSELNNIVEESEIIEVSRAPWSGSASVLPGKSQNKIIWVFNQPNLDFNISLIDKDTGKILFYDRSNEITEINSINGSPSLFNGNYKIVLSYLDELDPVHYKDLEKIQLEIDVQNNIPEPKWYIDLSYNPIKNVPNSYKFKIGTNSTHYGEDYSAYVVEDSTGKIINHYSGKDRDYDFIAEINNSNGETYTAYIADKNEHAKNYSDLINIIANSNSIYPRFVPGTGEYKPTGGRFGGGFNPSNTDCQQQCYGDPVNNYTGEYFENSQDLTVDSISPLSLTRSYSTFKKEELGDFGLGSTHNYNMSLIGEFNSINDSDNVRVIQENGSIIDFIRATDGTFIPSQGTQAELERINNNYVMTRKTGETFTFDNNGKLIKISDLFNNSVSLTYINNKVSKITADDGKFIQINYNSDTLISSITDRIRTNSYIYDSQKRLIEVESYETVNPKKYKYDTQDRVIEITQPNGGIYKNTFNSNNQVIKQVNPLNGETLFKYYEYSDTYETKIILPDGSIKIDKYDEYGRLTSEIFDEAGEHQTFSYEYTSNGQISRSEKPDGSSTRYIYDESGNITVLIDDLGRVTRFTYNDKNQVVERINPYGDVFTNTYDTEGHLQSTVDENENITKYSTNEKGRLIAITHPDQVGKDTPKSEKVIYDNNGFISQSISPEGSIQTTVNNVLGLPVTKTDSLNNSTSIEYDNHFNIAKQTYPNGTIEEYKYDNAGRLTKTIDVLGNESTYTYDLMDNVISSTNPFGATIYEYDADQRLIKTTEPTGAINEYRYDGLGQLIEIKDAEGSISQIEYNLSGNVVSETDFNGNTSYYDYDSIGNLTSVTDANYNSTYYSYDKLNRLVNLEKANWNSEQYKYDNVGNVINLNKNNVDSTNYAYDKNNQLIKTTYSDKSTDQKSYNADGSLTSFTNRDGKTTAYKYNLNSQIIEITRPDTSKESIKYNSMGEISQISYDNWTSINTEYEYNVLGQLTKSIKENEETTYAYDSIGQLTSRGPPSQQVGYSYDNYGRLNEIQYSFNSSVQYSYNFLNNIDKVMLDETEEIVEYHYDNNGNIVNELYGNEVERTSEYDVLNRITNFNIKKGSASLYNRSLSYDETYLIQSINTSINDIAIEDKQLSYSPLEKISEIYDYETDEQEDYNIDNFSNLLEAPVSNNAVSKNGELISSEINDVNYSYTFDDRGNRLSKTNDVNDSASAYSWSNDNKLENLTTTHVNGSSTSIDYTYDASGLLQSRAKDSVSTDDYVWDTLSSIPLLLEDGNNEYIYGNDASPVAQIDKDSGNLSYLHGDERGSVVLATDNAGNSLLTREYDAYGNHTDEMITNPSNAPPNDFDINFAYAGEYQDKDTGLYNLRARWYEPLTGSFINQDPALISTGEGYSYASGNPLSFTDPLGLYSMGPIPSDNTVGNMAAGFVDGLIGYPVVHKISNHIKPGSVSNCGPGYIASNVAGNLTGFAIPGGGVVKGVAAVGIIGIKGVSALTKINKADDGLEEVWRHGKIKERVDTAGIPRFNAQNPSFGEAAQHNADVLQGRVFLLQREIGDKKQIRKNRYHNTKRLQGKRSGYEKDEVPPASTIGSRNHDSSVRFILAKDNNAHGTSLGGFYKKNNINPGDWFIYE